MIRAMSSSVCRYLLAVVLFLVVMQEGLGLPLSGPSESPVQTPHRVRTKRCSCNSWLDKECIYFCHLDIIWVNTPSKILPYGMGSPLSRRRRRRSASRCECAEGQADTGCSSFCHNNSSENPEIVMESPLKASRHTDSNNKNPGEATLLASLRAAVSVNTAVAQKSRPAAKKLSKSTTRRSNIGS